MVSVTHLVEKQSQARRSFLIKYKRHAINAINVLMLRGPTVRTASKELNIPQWYYRRWRKTVVKVDQLLFLGWLNITKFTYVIFVFYCNQLLSIINISSLPFWHREGRQFCQQRSRDCDGRVTPSGLDCRVEKHPRSGQSPHWIAPFSPAAYSLPTNDTRHPSVPSILTV